MESVDFLLAELEGTVAADWRKLLVHFGSALTMRELCLRNSGSNSSTQTGLGAGRQHLIAEAPESEHSGTIPGAIGDILPPGVALTSNLAVIFTLNQYRRR